MVVVSFCCAAVTSPGIGSQSSTLPSQPCMLTATEICAALMQRAMSALIATHALPPSQHRFAVSMGGSQHVSNCFAQPPPPHAASDTSAPQARTCQRWRVL